MQRRIGVLALQGAVGVHVRHLEACGATGFPVRSIDQLDACDGLIIPGGESTAISKLLDTSQLRAPLERLIAEGIPVLGTCAGLILIAKEVKDRARDGHPKTLGGLDVAVVRNAYGRQLQSCEVDLPLAFDGPPLHGVFIRAPRIVEVGTQVEVLAQLDGDPVWVRDGNRHGVSFHPELTQDVRVHQRFLEDVL